MKLNKALLFFMNLRLQYLFPRLGYILKP